MKKVFILLAAVGLLVSCQNLKLDFWDVQVQKWVTPENVSLAVSAAYLDKHPEADVTMLQMVDEIREVADEGMFDLETAYAKIEKGLKDHDMKYTKEVLFLLDGLFNHYAYVFDSKQVDVIEYRDTLYQIADGIEAALTIVQTRELRKLEQEEEKKKG